MVAATFDRDEKARWYAHSHLEVDSGVGPICYLPTKAPEREIRLIEVNRLMPPRTDDFIEPLSIGIETGTENAHRLSIIDVTPEQWDRIASHALQLPSDWSIDGAIMFTDCESRPLPLGVAASTTHQSVS